MVSNNYKLNYLPRHDNKLSQAPRLDGFLQRFVHWPNENKEATLLGGGGGCVEICLNEVVSPSPGELLFDASAQSPPSDKTVEMLCTYQCKPRGGGGGECRQGVGIWQILKFFDQIPQGGKRKVNQKCQKSPHPRGKNLNKQYYNTV